MGSSVFVNKQGWSHKGSGGVANNTAPDVCLTQVGIAVVPIPYSNIARSSDLKDGAKTVKVDGEMPAIDGCCYSKSTGDEAGNQKGIASGTVGDKAQFINYSNNVFCEGKSVCRNADSMTMNNKNTIGMNSDSSADPPMSKIPPPPKATIRIKVVEHISWKNYDKKERRFTLGHEDNKPIAGHMFKIRLPSGDIIPTPTNDEGVIELPDQDSHGRFEFIYEPENAKLNSRYFIFSRGITLLKREL